MISVLARVAVATLSLLLSTALQPLFVPLLIWKLVVWVFIWMIYGRTRSLAGPIDCWYLSLPKEKEMNIVAAFKLEGRWDESVYDLGQQIFDEMMRDVRRFKLNAVPTQFLGFWCWDWRQERLDVRQCMKIPEYVDTNTIYRKKDVEEYVSQVMGTPFPEGQPPWSIAVFPKFDDDNHMCGVLRFHHGLADGVSLTAFVERHLNVKGNGCEETDKRTTSLSRGSCWKMTLLYVEAACLAIPVTLYVSIRTLIRRIGLISPEGNFRVCSSERFAVARLKQVAAEKKTRVGDLLLAAAIHASSSHCIFKKGQPSPSTTFYTLFTLNKGDSDALKNQLLIYPVNFNTDGLLTAEERLDNVSKVMNGLRCSFQIPLSFGVGCLFGLFLFPSWLQARLFCLSDAPMGMSNVPGPRAPVSFGHLRAVDFFTFGRGLDKTGIAMLSFSYNGFMKCSFYIDGAFLKKNHTVEDVAEDFNIYMNQMFR